MCSCREEARHNSKGNLPVKLVCLSHDLVKGGRPGKNKHKLTVRSPSCRKMNTSPATLDEGNLDIPLTNPPLKAVKIYFPTGLNVTARNLKKGVTIKDALKAIHKQFHKKV